MGGVVPLGYRVEDRALHIVDDHAAIVRSLFRRYPETGSVVRLKQSLDAEGLRIPITTSMAQAARPAEACSAAGMPSDLALRKNSPNASAIRIRVNEANVLNPSASPSRPAPLKPSAPGRASAAVVVDPGPRRRLAPAVGPGDCDAATTAFPAPSSRSRRCIMAASMGTGITSSE